MTSPSAVPWALPTIVRALREATREAHERLDAQTPLAASHIDLVTYNKILGRYLVAHGAVESALEPWAASLAHMGLALDARCKVPLLRRDIACTAALLAKDPDNSPNAMPFTLPTLASAWGALYVVEGSTLGGQHIVKGLLCSDLVRRDGLTADAGLVYFTGYSSETGVMWRQFLSALDAADASDPASRDAIIQGAQSTFALFERVLSPDLSPTASS